VGLIESLPGGIFAFDTNCLIYYIEKHHIFSPIVKPLFQAVQEGRLVGVTSAVTLAEVMTLPLRQHKDDLANRYFEILVRSENITLLPIDAAMARQAALLRSRYEGLRTPDAFQLAAGILSSAAAFVCNDHRLKIIREIPLLLLKDYC
jgi:predicted nucleic acid-binding protein